MFNLYFVTGFAEMKVQKLHANAVCLNKEGQPRRVDTLFLFVVEIYIRVYLASPIAILSMLCIGIVIRIFFSFSQLGS